MERQTKDTAIGENKALFDKMTAAVFLDFKGMRVEHVTKLRAEFRKAGVDYKVVKNTLVKHAIKGAPYEQKLDDVLVGMTGIAWSYEDPLPESLPLGRFLSFDDRRVSVSFPGRGTKKFIERYAQLQQV